MTPHKKIQKFIKTIERIKLSRFVRETKNIGFELDFELNKNGSQKITGADEEDLRSMLIDLRKLTLEKEDVYLLEILNLLINKTTSETNKLKIKEWKEAYENFLSSPPAISMKINEKTETVWEILEKWLYGYYFHEHDNHQKYLDGLNFSSPIHKYNFTLAVITLIKIASTISHIAEEVLNEKEF